jgi:hypothetical protein
MEPRYGSFRPLKPREWYAAAFLSVSVAYSLSVTSLSYHSLVGIVQIVFDSPQVDKKQVRQINFKAPGGETITATVSCVPSRESGAFIQLLVDNLRMY